MATTRLRKNEFDDLDRPIVRALVTLRSARDECRRAATPRNLDVRDRAEENLNALLDFRSDACRRPSPGSPTPAYADADRLPA